MKRVHSNLLFVFAVPFFLFSAAVAQEKAKTAKMRVAVFAFEDKTEHRWHWWNGQPPGDGMADMITTALVKSGNYRVFERQEIEKIMQEQALGMSGAVTPESAAKAGKML
ncbi:MAG: CsgG/HfaB family protein, partial [bacterium]